MLCNILEFVPPDIYLDKLKIVKVAGIEPLGNKTVALVLPPIYVIGADAPLPLSFVLVIVPEVVACLLLPLVSYKVVPLKFSAK